MKLFEVRITSEVVIAANNQDEAEQQANKLAKTILSDEDIFEIDVTREIDNVNDMPHLWDGACIPYGDTDGNTRIHHILDNPLEAS